MDLSINFITKSFIGIEKIDYDLFEGLILIIKLYTQITIKYLSYLYKDNLNYFSLTNFFIIILKMIFFY